MLIRTIRDLTFAIAFLGIPWLAHGQTDQNNSQKELFFASDLAESAQLSGPTVFRDALSEAIAELIFYESSVLSELRRGVNRLGKGCMTSSSPKSDAENALLSRNTLAFEQALSITEGRLDKLRQVSSTYEQAAKRQTAQSCSALSSGLGLFKSNACKQAQDTLSAVTIYRTEMQRYYKLQSERYRAYLDLVQFERQGCVRSGFSSRLVQANEAHMRESEAQSQRLLERSSREFNKYLGIAGPQK